MLGLQGGFTKYCCFLYLWDIRDTKNHYKVKGWPNRTDFVMFFMVNITYKTWFDENFVKAMDKNGKRFLYLKSVFSKLSDPKLNEGIFVSPKI